MKRISLGLLMLLTPITVVACDLKTKENNLNSKSQSHNSENAHILVQHKTDPAKNIQTKTKPVNTVNNKIENKTKFMPFADFTLNGTARGYAKDYAKNNLKDFMAGFVIMRNGQIAMSTWEDITNITSDINEISDSGVNVGVSFGGASGTSPSVYAADNAKDVDWLYNQYVSIINQVHNIKYLDWDVEGTSINNSMATNLRNKAIWKIHQNYPNIKLSVTIATTPNGPLQAGYNIINNLKGALTSINIMAMDYGPTMNGNQMLEAAKTATIGTANYLVQNGWVKEENKFSMIGLIPMIGKNDIQSEVFTLEAAKKLTDWSIQNNLGFLSMWSLTRDEAGGGSIRRRNWN